MAGVRQAAGHTGRLVGEFATRSPCAPRPVVVWRRMTAGFDPERDARFLRRCIEQAERRTRAGAGGPFAALVARGDDVIAEGWNEVTSTNDPTAHAEVQAM